jgi:hypothetical protein
MGNLKSLGLKVSQKMNESQVERNELVPSELAPKDQ